MRKVLIISPYFPPTNAADMQRVRMSLPYFSALDWEAEVVTVDDQYADIAKDELLLQSIQQGIKIHKVKALDKGWTSKIGLGSIALRSLWYYRKKVNDILKTGKYDLIYFSTTQFPVCVLGAFWKKRFGIPYVIDMQDPWHSEYYQDKPKSQRPSKYWFSYRLNKYLEPIALKKCDGLISVSKNYIDDLKDRYPKITSIPATVITFGSFDKDFEIAKANKAQFGSLLNPDHINLVYVGRGGGDMHRAIKPIFEALKSGFENEPKLFEKLKLYFIGTSYAANGKGAETIIPLAERHGVAHAVTELTGRISFYHTLNTLQQADALFVPGSDDPKYTASKIYPYLQTLKPLLTIFNSKSSAISTLDEFGAAYNYTFDATENLPEKINNFLIDLINRDLKQPVYNAVAEEKYSAKNMTKLQCAFFDKVLTGETL